MAGIGVSRHRARPYRDGRISAAAKAALSAMIVYLE